jgi:sec-independent protein translocase protein TatB
MFDIGASEFLLIAIVAIVVIGPKDLPRALRTAGQWIAKIRRMSGHFRSGIETMIREAELAEMEKKWREQNEAIMQAHPPASTSSSDVPEASAEAAVNRIEAEEPYVSPPPNAVSVPETEQQEQPQLPLTRP